MMKYSSLKNYALTAFAIAAPMLTGNSKLEARPASGIAAQQHIYDAAHFFSPSVPLIPGKKDISGNINMDQTRGTDLILDGDGYKACLATAAELKSQYGVTLSKLNFNDPNDLKKYLDIEKKIVTALNDEYHKQLGDFNEAVRVGELLDQNALARNQDPSLHNDMARYNTKNPAHLSEFKNKNGQGEVICRHDAPTANALCYAAGLKTFRSQGFLEGYMVFKDENGQSKIASDTSGGGHVWTISQAGNTIRIIDFTAKGSDAYVVPVNNPSLKDIESGTPLIVPKNTSGHFYIFRHDSDAMTPTEANNLSPRKLQKHMTREKAAQSRADAYVQSKYDTYIKPTLVGLKTLTAKGDVQGVQSSLDNYPFTPRDMIPAFNQSVADHSQPLAKMFIDSGVTNEPAFQRPTYIQMIRNNLKGAPTEFIQFIQKNTGIEASTNAAPATIAQPLKPTAAAMQGTLQQPAPNPI